MKKTIKLILIILSLACIFTLFTTKYSYADIDVNSFDPWDTQPEGIDGDTVTKYTNRFLGVLSIIGIVVSVISLMILGLKFIMAGATEKAEYKKHLVPIVVGISMMVFIFSILGALNSLGESINSEGKQVYGPQQMNTQPFIGPTRP